MLAGLAGGVATTAVSVRLRRLSVAVPPIAAVILGGGAAAAAGTQPAAAAEVAWHAKGEAGAGIIKAQRGYRGQGVGAEGLWQDSYASARHQGRGRGWEGVEPGWGQVAG